MHIYYVGKQSSIEGPYEIRDRDHHTFLQVGDICVRGTEHRLDILVIQDVAKNWKSCRCLGWINTEETILSGNMLLFSFDGISQRNGSIEGLKALAKASQAKLLKQLFLDGIDILNYKSDCWDINVFLQLVVESDTQPQKSEFSEKTVLNITSQKKLFIEYLTEQEQAVFYENCNNGIKPREAFMAVRQAYPVTFRKAILQFAHDWPNGNIFDMN